MQGMLKGFVATAGVVALALAGSIAAQSRQATVQLKSGETVTGEFEDIQNNQVYVRTSHDDERRLALDQVVSIQFSGGSLSQNDLRNLRSSDDVLVLSNGTRLTGELVDVTREGEGGERTIADAAVTFVFRTANGRQEIPAQQVSAVYLKPASQSGTGTTGTGTTGSATGSTDTPGQYNVSSTRQWTPTGIMVRSGQMVSFNASGEVQLGNGETAQPAGVSSQRREATAPLPTVLAGALIGRVGNSAPFGIGNQTGPIRMPASGELFLGVNDGRNSLNDNTGGFTVQVTVQPFRGRR